MYIGRGSCSAASSARIGIPDRKVVVGATIGRGGAGWLCTVARAVFEGGRARAGADMNFPRRLQLPDAGGLQYEKTTFTWSGRGLLRVPKLEGTGCESPVWPTENSKKHELLPDPEEELVGGVTIAGSCGRRTENAEKREPEAIVAEATLSKLMNSGVAGGGMRRASRHSDRSIVQLRHGRWPSQARWLRLQLSQARKRRAFGGLLAKVPDAAEAPDRPEGMLRGWSKRFSVGLMSDGSDTARTRAEWAATSWTCGSAASAFAVSAATAGGTVQ
jgi:hypothetical protein